MVKRIHGRDGELLIKLLTDFGADRFREGSELFLSLKNQEARQKVLISSSRSSNLGPLVKLEGYQSREDVWNMFGASFFIPASQLAEPESGNYYPFQLEGCEVYQADEKVGQVAGLVDNPKGNPYLEVETQDGKSEWIPFVSQVVISIDLDNQRIDVVEGFFG